MEKNLSTLPEEVLLHIAGFVGPRDILALSASCHRLRTVFNTDSVWRKFTHGGLLSQGLNNVTSIVSPIYISPDNLNSDLEALCEHRTHFLKHSRLLTNLLQGKYIKHSLVPFEDYLADFETSNLFSCGQVTFKGVYLFATANAESESLKLILRVYDIRNEPKVIHSLELPQHVAPPDYNLVIWLQVSGDLLICCQDNWVDIFMLKIVLCQEDSETTFGSFPNVEVKFQKTIQTGPPGTLNPSLPIIFQDLLFFETDSVVRVWSLKSSLKLIDILPKVNDKDANVEGYVCSYSQELKCVLFVVKSSKSTETFHNLFLFDLSLMQYKDTCLQLIDIVDLNGIICLSDTCYVVVIQKSRSCISVYDISKYSLLVEKSGFEIDRDNEHESFYYEYSQIIKGCLALPTPFDVKIMSLKNLNILWRLKFECGGLIPELPQFCLMDFKSIDVLGNRILLVTKNTNFQVELWDFQTRKKILKFVNCGYFTFNDTFSKLITVIDYELNILTFW